MQRFTVAFLLLGVAVAPAWSQIKDPAACDMPSDLTTPSAPLPRVAAALARNRLDILALGSGSTIGKREHVAAGDQASGASFPYRMASDLQSLRPGLRVNLTVKGGRSITAEEMLPILRQELAAHHYDLVLWQTGTVEAVHGVRPDLLASVLQDGADAVAEGHADLVLIDSQFSRFLRANVDLTPYETVLEQMTTLPAVTLFRRLDLTREWVTSGQLDLERVSRDQRDRTITSLSGCLGLALARYVLTGAAEH